MSIQKEHSDFHKAFEETPGELTQAERDALPPETFGLPDKRAYPMPDKSHAANAKSRAAEELAAGNLTAAEKAQIDAKADEVLGK